MISTVFVLSYAVFVLLLNKWQLFLHVISYTDITAEVFEVLSSIWNQFKDNLILYQILKIILFLYYSFWLVPQKSFEEKSTLCIHYVLWGNFTCNLSVKFCNLWYRSNIILNVSYLLSNTHSKFWKFVFQEVLVETFFSQSSSKQFLLSSTLFVLLIKTGMFFFYILLYLCWSAAPEVLKVQSSSGNKTKDNFIFYMNSCRSSRCMLQIQSV